MKLLKYTIPVIIAFILMIGTGNSFAQQESGEQPQDKEPDVLEEIEKRTEQVHGIVTNIKGITDLMNDPEQCTECENAHQEKQDEQFWILFTTTVGGFAAVIIVTVFGFRGNDTLISGIIANMQGILASKQKEPVEGQIPPTKEEEIEEIARRMIKSGIYPDQVKDKMDAIFDSEGVGTAKKD